MHHPTTLATRPPARPDASGPTLTPLGPGGRPFARWRGVVTLVALVAVAGVVALLLSARAPDVIDEVSDRVAVRVDREAPEARSRAQETLQRHGVEEKDTLAHVGLWAGATLIAGLATWSWRSLATLVGLLLVGSTALELVQQTLTPSRITEWRDVGANTLGIALGAVAVVALSSVSGLPARIRRRRRGEPLDPVLPAR